ncbi:unnamed protein product [Peronospora effusa]|nr:unnamed protein product [Peronospora effusa]
MLKKQIVPNLRIAKHDVRICDSKCHAHEWMPLEGVRPHGDDLCQALLCWKSKDFTIVEVEQPDSSVSLRYRARWCLSWVERKKGPPWMSCSSLPCALKSRSSALCAHSMSM